ncbi:hypothetical protein ACLOJK_011516 [Asimina triloba]
MNFAEIVAGEDLEGLTLVLTLEIFAREHRRQRESSPEVVDLGRRSSPEGKTIDLKGILSPEGETINLERISSPVAINLERISSPEAVDFEGKMQRRGV